MPSLNFRHIRFVLLSLLLLAEPSFSGNGNLRFAVIPQGVGNDFFDDVQVGCEQAAQDLGGVECHYGGPVKAEARAQSLYINQLIDEGIDGIAVSIIDSSFFARKTALKAQKSGIPLISFNSDFDKSTLETFENIRDSYVGTDNFQLGWELGEQTKLLRPNGGRLCLISGHKSSPALERRVAGVRTALAGISDSSITLTKLVGQNGWTEYSRCPFYSNDLPHRALTQLLHVLDKNKHTPNVVDTVVSVGAWPQQNESAYQEAVTPYKEALASKKIVVVMGDAMKQQIRLLEDNLAHANVGQNPYQMGYQAIVMLKRLVEGKSVPDIVYTPMIKCLPDQKPLCGE